jgi:hypothetical protein
MTSPLVPSNSSSVNTFQAPETIQIVMIGEDEKGQVVLSLGHYSGTTEASDNLDKRSYN